MPCLVRLWHMGSCHPISSWWLLPGRFHVYGIWGFYLPFLLTIPVSGLDVTLSHWWLLGRLCIFPFWNPVFSPPTASGRAAPPAVMAPALLGGGCGKSLLGCLQKRSTMEVEQRSVGLIWEKVHQTWVLTRFSNTVCWVCKWIHLVGFKQTFSILLSDFLVICKIPLQLRNVLHPYVYLTWLFIWNASS